MGEWNYSSDYLRSGSRYRVEKDEDDKGDTFIGGGGERKGKSPHSQEGEKEPNEGRGSKHWKSISQTRDGESWHESWKQKTGVKGANTKTDHNAQADKGRKVSSIRKASYVEGQAKMKKIKGEGRKSSRGEIRTRDAFCLEQKTCSGTST